MFEEDGYQIIRGVVAAGQCASIARSISFLQQKGLLKYGDGQVEKSYSAYGVPLTERLLQSLCAVFSRAANCRLVPTYSYLRVYLKGAALHKHVDRESCEVSVSLAIDLEGPKVWPLFLEVNENPLAIELQPGDALLYKGQAIPHWRECFDGERQVQIFLHYVRESGQYKEFRFDQRSGIRTSPLT